jgi:hypothetical protein
LRKSTTKKVEEIGSILDDLGHSNETKKETQLVTTKGLIEQVVEFIIAEHKTLKVAKRNSLIKIPDDIEKHSIVSFFKRLL